MVEVLTGVNAGETAARWSPRWPEMRGDVPEGVGMREKHQDARLDAVNTQVVVALAGVHPNGGARWLQTCSHTLIMIIIMHLNVPWQA